ncbi:MAG: phosphate signaling complex protein PhoU [Elusimicrobia bacterium]|nr:phosphate signaling complex protein PhoU [Elusimicrobiota bacterium]
MKRHVHEEIEALKNRILHMGSIAEEMIQLSVKSFLERKEEVCQQVFDHEENVNKLQMEIDESCVKILALYQPEASDLRVIMASMKINAELERVADQAVNITQTTYYHLLKEIPLKTLMELPKMATIAQEMVKESLDAFSKGDVALAQEVLKKDEEEDVLKAKAMNEIIGVIPQHPDRAKQLVDLILIAKNLEKIGDHATNIAEDVIFMVLGQDVRHHAPAK